MVTTEVGDLGSYTVGGHYRGKRPGGHTLRVVTTEVRDLGSHTVGGHYRGKRPGVTHCR